MTAHTAMLPVAGDPIDSLPSVLKDEINAGRWISANAVTIRQAARIVGRAQWLALYGCHDALIALATASLDEIAQAGPTKTPAMIAIRTWLLPLVAASPLSLDWLHTTELSQVGRFALSRFETWLEDEICRANADADADNDEIGHAVDRVAALYPDLGLSYGYIGNLSFQPLRDDRSYCVFTRLMAGNKSLTFAEHSAEQRGMYTHLIKQRLEGWAAALQLSLEAGAISRQ